ncbi:hypothetical protein C8R47DRAFT_148507 [Mycena vitilis]|nr:hypothetical protein C8R47DRAFT_148507 [Mycena vitilis]
MDIFTLYKLGVASTVIQLLLWYALWLDGGEGNETVCRTVLGFSSFQPAPYQRVRPRHSCLAVIVCDAYCAPKMTAS